MVDIRVNTCMLWGTAYTAGGPLILWCTQDVGGTTCNYYYDDTSGRGGLINSLQAQTAKLSIGTLSGRGYRIFFVILLLLDTCNSTPT